MGLLNTLKTMHLFQQLHDMEKVMLASVWLAVIFIIPRLVECLPRAMLIMPCVCTEKQIVLNYSEDNI